MLGYRQGHFDDQDSMGRMKWTTVTESLNPGDRASAMVRSMGVRMHTLSDVPLIYL